MVDCLEVAAKNDKLEFIRAHVREAAFRSGIKNAGRAIFPLEAAVSEFCDNVIRHGYRNGHGRLLLITAVYLTRVAVTIIDKSHPFDITKYARLAKDRHGAFDEDNVGLKVIFSMCDRIIYTRKNNINETELIKYID